MRSKRIAYMKVLQQLRERLPSVAQKWLDMEQGKYRNTLEDECFRGAASVGSKGLQQRTFVLCSSP